MGNLLSKDEIFQQRGTSISGLETALVLNRAANVRCHETLAIIDFEVGQMTPGGVGQALSSRGETSWVCKGALSPGQASNRQGDGGSQQSSRHVSFISTEVRRGKAVRDVTDQWVLRTRTSPTL